MRIFVTGGTGFVGSHVAPMLKNRGHRLLLLARDARREPGVVFVKGDLAHIDKWQKRLKAFRPDAALHLAWEGIPSNDLDVSLKNFVNGANLFRALGEAGCKTIVAVGSGHEYGEPGKKVNEQQPLDPFNALYEAKAALYSFGSRITEYYKMKLVWARPFFIYGPGQRSKALIPYLVSAIKAGERPRIKTPNGANDFVYIDDVARALVGLVEQKPKSANEVYNIGSGKLTPVAEIVENVYNALRIKPPTLGRRGKPKGFWADATKIKKDIGWKPRVGIREGIQKTVHYFAQL